MNSLNEYLKSKTEFIEKRIEWLDSDIRMGSYSQQAKQEKIEMKEFLQVIRSFSEPVVEINSDSVKGLTNPVEHCVRLEEELEYQKNNYPENVEVIHHLNKRVKELSAWIVHNY